MANLRAKAEAINAETIDEHEGALPVWLSAARTGAAGHTRLALHAFSTTTLGCLQTSFYLDDPNELQKALLA